MTPSPEDVRRAVQDALARPEDLAAAFDDPSGARWRERSLARFPCPSWVHPLDRRAWQRARDRLWATAPVITAVEVVACPVWWCDTEDDASTDWQLVLGLLGAAPALASQLVSKPAPVLPVVAHARVSVADIVSMSLARSYGPGVPGVERFEPFVVVRHQVLRVDTISALAAVPLVPAPTRLVGPWASDAEAAFAIHVLAPAEQEALQHLLASARIQPEPA